MLIVGNDRLASATSRGSLWVVQGVDHSGEYLDADRKRGVPLFKPLGLLLRCRG